MEKLLLIDGHSILNRAFFGLPDLTNSEGLHTNAVYGFLNIMFKIIEEEKPNYLTVCFDLSAPTFRHKMFDGYKGTRKPMAEELRQQVPLMKEMLTAMGVTVVTLEGYEADDLLGTLSVLGEQRGMEVSVLSGDRDLLQLATDHVMIRIPKTKKTGTEIENYHADQVRELYLVSPKEFIDVKALMGDNSDNIPGVPSIGEKTASALIAQYGSIEAVHEHAAEVKPPRAAKNIVEYWDQAVLSKTLATIITDVPVEYDFDKAKLAGIEALYTPEAFALCKRLEFKNLLSRFSNTASAAVEEAQELACTPGIIRDKKGAEAFFKKAAKAKNLSLSFLREKEGGKKKTQESDGQLLLFASQTVNAYEGLTLCFDQNPTFLLTGEDLTSDWLNEKLQELVDGGKQLIVTDVKETLLCFDPTEKAKISGDMEAYKALRHQYFDVTLAAYLCNPTLNEYPYENIAKDFLGSLVASKEELLGKKTILAILEEDPDLAAKAVCLEAYVNYMAAPKLREKLKELGMEGLYDTMEMPLAFVLSDMEREGILMDAEALAVYSKELAGRIADYEQKIYQAAGEEFNINSPKQLGTILFEKLQLPNGKKTKTGYSTSAEVLDKLAHDYPIVEDILAYRQLAKLKSTYADGLQAYVREDGRIHTSFNQTITATGRLSSTEPNLQNIPIRIEEGKRIRKVFFPKEGCVFVDSDYSQIELRLLAHMSGDANLIEAFAKGQDIHQSTASLVFHTPFEEVTPLQRRNAKAVNFGIVYGISAFGLAQDLDIDRKEAQAYIDSYFATYPAIKNYLDQTVEDAKESGATTTLYGRIRPIPELKSSNFMQRQFGERVAMNAPIQGTAADIMKLAMIGVHDRLLAEGRKSRILLQVHDELLLEVPEEEQEEVTRLLEEEMRGAAELSVVLEVGTEVGKTWYDAH